MAKEAVGFSSTKVGDRIGINKPYSKKNITPRFLIVSITIRSCKYAPGILSGQTIQEGMRENESNDDLQFFHSK